MTSSVLSHLIIDYSWNIFKWPRTLLTLSVLPCAFLAEIYPVIYMVLMDNVGNFRHFSLILTRCCQKVSPSFSQEQKAFQVSCQVPIVHND